MLFSIICVHIHRVYAFLKTQHLYNINLGSQLNLKCVNQICAYYESYINSMCVHV